MKLSIIIPVYNTGKTLDRCINSVIKQTWTDYEVILIDDGSSDDSGMRCDLWKERDGRIAVIHQHNGGLSNARNSGLKIAKGDYITFIDSDDAIADDTLMKLMQELICHPEYDLLEYPVYMAYGTKKQWIMTLPDGVYHRIVDDYWLACQTFSHTYACNKIYRKALFLHNYFPQGMKFEDAHILPAILKRCTCVRTSSAGLYYYYLNTEGITNTATGSDLSQLLAAHVSTFKDIRHKAKNRMGLMTYYMYIVNIQCDVCEQTGKGVILPRMHCPFIYFLKREVSLKYKMKALYLNIFGLNSLCDISKRLHKLI